MDTARIQQGSVFYIDNVPDENGQNETNRRIIVISPTKKIAGAAEILFCGASSSAYKQGCIRVPSRAENPSCRTGFPDRTWAVPTWLIVVPTELVPPKKEGFITGVTLQQIISSTDDAMEAETAVFQRIKKPCE